MTAALPLHEYQLGPSFLWATPAARTTVFAWARDAFIAQIAANTQPFEELSDDCAGDVLEFLDTTMARAEILHVATHCSSTEAHAWLHEVLAAAITVRDLFANLITKKRIMWLQTIDVAISRPFCSLALLRN